MEMVFVIEILPSYLFIELSQIFSCSWMNPLHTDPFWLYLIFYLKYKNRAWDLLIKVHFIDFNLIHKTYQNMNEIHCKFLSPNS